MVEQRQGVGLPKYVLPRDEYEKNRLIYDKDVQISANCKVLDTGTGTGVWITDLARVAPEGADLIGCDVSAKNFPREVPNNVRFLTSSVTSLPVEWSNAFIFINQRLLFLGLLASDWPVALSELYRVLEPSGHIQLIEMDFAAGAINEGPRTRAILDLVLKLMEWRGLIPDCSSKLSKMMEDAGFVDIRVEKKYLPLGKAWGKIGEMGKENFRMGGYSLMPMMVAAKVAESEKVVSETLEAAVAEWDEVDNGMQYVGHIAYARKP